VRYCFLDFFVVRYEIFEVILKLFLGVRFLEFLCCGSVGFCGMLWESVENFCLVGEWCCCGVEVLIFGDF
jgi:hypothetical protein